MKLKDIKAVITVNEDGTRARLIASSFTTEFSCINERKQSLADFDLMMSRWIDQQGGIESLDITKAEKCYMFITVPAPFYVFGGAQ